MTNLAVWYAHIDIEAAMREMEQGVSPAVRKRAEANLAKARTRDSLQAFNKLTHVVDGERRIISDPPLIQPIEELFEGHERDEIHEQLRGVIRGYRATLQSDRRHLLEEFRLVDIARKVVGVGSVGTRAWIILMLGRDDDDPLFLQAKEAQASVLEEFVGHEPTGVARANGSSTVSISCRPAATSSSVGISVAGHRRSRNATTTSDSSVTGRAQPWSRP